MAYTPYIFAINNHIQGIIYTLIGMIETRVDYLSIKYDRELFTLKDGGTLAIDWYDGSPTPGDEDQRPILVCISGLGGST